MPANLRTVTLTSGETLAVSKNLTVIVGPNNVGKSVLLSSLHQKLHFVLDNPPLNVPVVESLEVALPPRDELMRRLDALGTWRPPGQYPQGHFYEDHYSLTAAGGQVITTSQIERLYSGESSAASTLGVAAGLLAVILPPESRLGQLGQVGTPNLLLEEPQQPLQLLFADRSLERKLAAYAHRAFGIDLTLNRHAGSQVSLHVGKPNAVEPVVGELTDYQGQLAALPSAANQGHGVQAFLGILLTLATRAFDIVLIDEPEAFLHPPQARLLGEIFVELSKQGSQVVVATHSNDFLQGVLTGSGVGDVTIVRLTRPAPEINAIAQVEPVAVKALFDDALLRYSNILDGIFYKGIVLCEAHADCKYYAAVLDDKFSADDSGRARPDLLFTQCGGKDRFAKAASALRATRVPTAVIADIDMLNDEAKFKELFKELGGNFDHIQGRYNDVIAAVTTKASAPDRQFTRNRIEQVFDASEDKVLEPEESTAIRELTKVTSGWDVLKKGGAAALPNGGPTKSFNEILAECKKVGLFILSVGELECFHSEIPSRNKQKWLREVFEQELFRNSPDAVELLEGVNAFVLRQQ